MGQYYNILTQKNGRYKVYDRSIINSQGKRKYMLAKLMEHSWIGNDTMSSLANIILRNPTRIAWVGDYANGTQESDITNPDLDLSKVKELYRKAYKLKEHSMEYRPLNVEYMLLVNWSKKEFIDMYEYIKRNTIEGWCIHPLSLLTAIGNGFGGGDYRGINQELVGQWAFDEISFEQCDMKDDLISKGFIEMFCDFKEE